MTPLIRENIAWTTRAGMDPTELQWVRPCKVGDASKGVVFKDYQVKEQR